MNQPVGPDGLVVRPPRPSLRPFVNLLWAVEPAPGAYLSSPERREWVLPTGSMHLAFRLGGPPLRLFDGTDDETGRSVGHAVVGGVRVSPYARETSGPAAAAAPTVGAQLHAGASELLFGASADELADRHTTLDDLWGQSVDAVRDRLRSQHSPEQRLQVLEERLAARLPAVHGVHPAVAHALDRFTLTAASVRDVVRQTGYSHRHFAALFRRAVGVSPKVYCRLLRFQRALESLAQGPGTPLAWIALRAGYADQAHFNREFRDFAGATPGEYRRLAPERMHHVPLSPRAR